MAQFHFRNIAWCCLILSTALFAGCADMNTADANRNGKSTNSGSADTQLAVFTRQGSFEDARDAVEMAITNRGMVINNVAHIGDMLERTGKDLGDNRQVFLKAEALEFCSAVVSRKMMESDPDNIVFCPYVISIYVVPGQPGAARIAYRRPQITGSPDARKALMAVDKLLSDIVQEALQ